MAGTAEKADPVLWERVKRDITAGGRGGKPGQWSARKAQLAVHDYKNQGGSYKGGKDADNHLGLWTKEQWGTKSGKPSGTTGERYLPKRARRHLTEAEYAETTAKKRADSKQGKQFSAQPPAIARKTAKDREAAQHAPNGILGGRETNLAGLKRTELMAMAAQAGIAGRSRMSKDDLLRSLRP